VVRRRFFGCLLGKFAKARTPTWEGEMKKRRLHRRYGRAASKGKPVFPGIPAGRDMIGGPGGRYEVIYGGDIVYRGDSSQKANAVFKKWVAETKLRNGDDVYMMDYERDDDPIREHRNPGKWDKR
jgi:hypothetical protein